MFLPDRAMLDKVSGLFAMVAYTIVSGRTSAGLIETYTITTITTRAITAVTDVDIPLVNW